MAGFTPGGLRKKLNAASRQTKLSVNPIGLLGDKLRGTSWPEPDPNVQRGGGSVTIPGGKRRRRRRRRGPVGDTKNDLGG